MKRIKVIPALLMVIGLSLSACSTGGATPQPTAARPTAIEDVVVGLSIGTTAEERWQREIEMFETCAEEQGFTLLMRNGEESVEAQLQQCEELLEQDIQVLIIQSIDAEAYGPIVDAAHKKGVPVISYDRFIMNCDLDYYVTFDSYTVGRLQAELVVPRATSGNYIWLKGSPIDNNAHLIAEGQGDVLRPYVNLGAINIVLEEWCEDWSADSARELTELGLTMANGDIQGVIASNDVTAGGAIEALTAHGLNVPISGQDADLAACRRIVQGTQTGTVYKPTALLNQAACELAVALAMGQDPVSGVSPELGTWQELSNNFKDVPSFTVDVVEVDQSNLIDVVVNEYAYHSLEDLS